MRKKGRAVKILITILAAAALTVGVYVILRRGDTSHVFIQDSENELILIIDAGHGGDDGGAVSPGGMLESGINLDIAERIDSLAAFFGVRTVMTRKSDEIGYSPASTTIRERKAEDQHTRLALINSTPRAVFLSIHQNYYPEPEPFGAQALYAGTSGSEEFGKNLQKLLVSSLNPANRRPAERIQKTILLMNNIECPAVLIECGFLSNPEEEALLRTEEYRMKLAVVLTAGYLQNRESLKAIYGLQNTA